jgi:hypothetical protein
MQVRNFVPSEATKEGSFPSPAATRYSYVPGGGKDFAGLG